MTHPGQESEEASPGEDTRVALRFPVVMPLRLSALFPCHCWRRAQLGSVGRGFLDGQSN